MPDQLSSDLASLRISRPNNAASVSTGGFFKARYAVWIFSLIAFFAAAYALVLPRLESAFFQTEVELTEIASVSPATVASEVTASGYVVPQIVSKVGTKVAGKIAQVLVAQGQVVKAGTVIVQLDAADQESAVAASKARLAAGMAQAQQQHVQWLDAERRLKREQTLAAEGVTGKGAVEDLEAQTHTVAQALKAAEANVAAAQADLQQQVLGLEHLTIRAPINGTILTKAPEVGEVVTPTGEPLLEMADFASLVVEAEVPETRLSKVRIGAPAEIMLDAYPSQRYRGLVHEISPVVNRSKATVVVKVKFVGEASGVLPNMSARAYFLDKEQGADEVGQPPKIVVPGSAVADRGGTKVVFVVDAGKVRKVPVQLGPAFGSGYELVDGPRVGTQLVKNPPELLEDGQRIKERNAP